MMQNQTIRFDLQLPYEVKKEGKWFIAACPVLNVYSQGTTDAKAKQNLIEACNYFSNPVTNGEPSIKFSRRAALMP